MRSGLQSAPAPALKLEPRVTGFSEVDGVTHYTVETTVIERTAPGPHGDTATVIVVPASRRFSEFRSLHTTLTQLTPSVADSFPVSKSLFGGETVKKERVRLRRLRHGLAAQPSRAAGACAIPAARPRCRQPAHYEPQPPAPDPSRKGQEAPVLPRDGCRRHRHRAARRLAVLLIPPLRYRGRGSAGGGGAAVGGTLRARGGACR